MPTVRAYRARNRPTGSEQTQRRIKAAVRELLEEGTFHESTMEEVAARAGVSRATLYQHFHSRLDLVDAICDTFAENPALTELRKAVELPDPEAALAETIRLAVGFWASEDLVLREIYGVAAIDPAARDLVVRQRADRRGEMARLARHLDASAALRADTSAAAALATLMVLTSYSTFRELSEEGLDEAAIATALQLRAGQLLLALSP
ncbi:MAG: TetR/AcrR family transcriptional regulator [Solirubrobacterales bacterium]